MISFFKYSKLLGMILGVTLVSSLILSLLSLFNFWNSNLTTILNMVITMLTTFIFSFINGINSEKRGYLAGGKIGIMIVLSFFLLALIFFKVNFNISLLIYYLIILGVSVVGGMFGISRKKEAR